MDWTDIFGVVYPNLILGCALIISSVVQALTFSLTVYHALIILNLSWIVTFSAAPAFIISDNDKKRRIVGQLDNHTYQLMALCHVGHLTLSAAFGLWFFSSVAHFDKSGNGCTSSTLYYALWENVHADNPTFRRFWLAIYSIVVIPAVNFLFVALTFFLAFVAAVCAALPLVLTMSCCYSCLSDLKFQLIGQFVAALMILFPPALMVALTEKMISINKVGTDEKLWTFGQTFALLVALPPTWNSAKLAKRTFINIRTMIHVSPYRQCLSLMFPDNCPSPIRQFQPHRI